MEIGVFATLRPRPGHRDDLLAALVPLIEEARREPGTLVYSVHTVRKDSEDVVIYERYVDWEAWKHHRGSDAMRSTALAIDPHLGAAAEIVVTEVQGEIERER